MTEQRRRALQQRVLLLLFTACFGWWSCCREEVVAVNAFVLKQDGRRHTLPRRRRLWGWVQRKADGEWEWQDDEDDATTTTTTTVTAAEPLIAASATPQLPSGSYRPKQSLGQNYLKDPNTVAKIVRAFHQDATRFNNTLHRIVELGPGAGALTDTLVDAYGVDTLQCIEIDERSIAILQSKHPGLNVLHADVLQVDYPQLAAAAGDQQPLVVIGNLPYYITSQILFCLADASHVGAVRSATVTMQWEVGQRLVAKPRTKDYGILSVVFQLYTDSCACHFKIPPTVFYPQPKVDSALMGLHFCRPETLRARLAGVRPMDLRRVVTTAFQQRRKTLRNSLKKLARPSLQTEWWKAMPVDLPASVQQRILAGDAICVQQALPADWASKRPEELTPGQFVELTRLLLGAVPPHEEDLGSKVWRKVKHGA